jgi:hypothetical protein
VRHRRAGRGILELHEIAAASACPIQMGRKAVALDRLQQHDRLLADEDRS